MKTKTTKLKSTKTRKALISDLKKAQEGNGSNCDCCKRVSLQGRDIGVMQYNLCFRGEKYGALSYNTDYENLNLCSCCFKYLVTPTIKVK